MKSDDTELLQTVTVHRAHNSIVIPDYMLERANEIKHNYSTLSVSHFPVVACTLGRS